MEKNMGKPLVINLIGGPGSGKSTTAAGLFYELKKRGIVCELASEFAKDKVYEEAFRTMDDQIYIFAKQYHKIWRLRDKVEVIITDSPLPISLYYMKEPSEYFNSLVVEQYRKFNNLMFFIERGEGYEQEGRIQSLEESKQIDEEIKNLMEEYGIEYKSISQNNAINEILDDIKRNCNITWRS